MKTTQKKNKESICGNFIQKGDVVWCRKCENNHTIPGVRLNNKGLVKKK